MRRTHTIFSPFGIGFTLLVLVGLGTAYWRMGGLLFSPGKLSAQTRIDTTLQGLTSHSEFETECERCHTPLRNMQGELCLECHTAIAREIDEQRGSHSLFKEVMQCFTCHSDHQGRDFNLTIAALEHFDHDLAKFNLRWHQVDYAAEPIECQHCHSFEDGISTPVENCINCHGDYDSEFMIMHQQFFGRACLDCHDGQDRMTAFDHTQTNFPLIGQHSDLGCTECHQNAQFADTPSQCVDCHIEPQVHAGLFSDDCANCHVSETWSDAIWNGQPFDHLAQSGFSLERHLVDYADTPINCLACHLVTSDHMIVFSEQACDTCHQQANPIFMSEHRQQFGSKCLACHDGTGRLANFDHDQFFLLDGEHADLACESCHADQVFRGLSSDCVDCHAEPQIHAGLFGLQCQNCHSTQAWVPASLTSHTFPLDHGKQGLVSCDTCHPTSYVEYTCYSCHEHQPIEIEREHLEEGISNAELSECTRCHPNGLEND